MVNSINIRTISMLLSSLATLLAIACGNDQTARIEQSGQKDSSAPLPSQLSPAVQSPAPSAPTGDTNAQALLATTIAGMGNLKSYHAVADLIIGGQSARVEGDFGHNALEFTIHKVDGERTRCIVINDRAYVSSDDGATWNRDGSQTGPMMASMITAPVSPSMKLADQGTVVEGATEVVEGLPVRHLRVMTAQPTDIWIADVEGIGPLVRKIHLLITSADAEFDATVTYSNFNKPLNIKPPM